MTLPVAKKGDRIVGTDIHILMVSSPGGPVPTPTPMPFTGVIDGDLSPDVMVEDEPIAYEGSTASNSPAHIPTAGPFQKPPKDKATLLMGAATVKVNDKVVARMGDTALTCNDPSDLPNGTLVASSVSVLVG